MAKLIDVGSSAEWVDKSELVKADNLDGRKDQKLEVESLRADLLETIASNLEEIADNGGITENGSKGVTALQVALHAYGKDAGAIDGVYSVNNSEFSQLENLKKTRVDGVVSKEKLEQIIAADKTSKAPGFLSQVTKAVISAQLDFDHKSSGFADKKFLKKLAAEIRKKAEPKPVPEVNSSEGARPEGMDQRVDGTSNSPGSLESSETGDLEVGSVPDPEAEPIKEVSPSEGARPEGIDQGVGSGASSEDIEESVGAVEPVASDKLKEIVELAKKSGPDELDDYHDNYAAADGPVEPSETGDLEVGSVPDPEAEPIKEVSPSEGARPEGIDQSVGSGASSEDIEESVGAVEPIASDKLREIVELAKESGPDELDDYHDNYATADVSVEPTEASDLEAGSSSEPEPEPEPEPEADADAEPEPIKEVSPSEVARPEGIDQLIGSGGSSASSGDIEESVSAVEPIASDKLKEIVALAKESGPDELDDYHDSYATADGSVEPTEASDLEAGSFSEPEAEPEPIKEVSPSEVARPEGINQPVGSGVSSEDIEESVSAAEPIASDKLKEIVALAKKSGPDELDDYHHNYATADSPSSNNTLGIDISGFDSFIGSYLNPDSFDYILLDAPNVSEAQLEVSVANSRKILSELVPRLSQSSPSAAELDSVIGYLKEKAAEDPLALYISDEFLFLKKDVDIPAFFRDPSGDSRTLEAIDILEGVKENLSGESSSEAGFT